MSELRGSIGGCCATCSYSGFSCGGFTSTGVILVIFILLVIISRSWGFGC